METARGEILHQVTTASFPRGWQKLSKTGADKTIVPHVLPFSKLLLHFIFVRAQMSGYFLWSHNTKTEKMIPKLDYLASQVKLPGNFPKHCFLIRFAGITFTVTLNLSGLQSFIGKCLGVWWPKEQTETPTSLPRKAPLRYCLTQKPLPPPFSESFKL